MKELFFQNNPIDPTKNPSSKTIFRQKWEFMKIPIFLLLVVYVVTHYIYYWSNQNSFQILKTNSLNEISYRRFIHNKSYNSKSFSSFENKTYLWGHYEEYNLICSRIQSKFNKTNRVLTFKYFPYGFGNLFYSVVAVIGFAITHDYRLYYDYPSYNDYFDSCFSVNVLNEDEDFDYDLKCLNYRYCMKGLLVYNRIMKRGDLRKYFKTPKVLLGGSLMEIERVFDHNEYKKELNAIFGNTTCGPRLWDVRRTLLRMVMNPEPRLRAMYMKERSQLIRKKYTIGLQLRMGGDLANTYEDYRGVPLKRIDEVINQVRNVTITKKWNGKVQLFISSDSSYVIELIRNKTRNEFPVVSSQLFVKGHTEFIMSKDITRSVLVDMYYMSMADHVIVTWPSSLGRLMCFMNRHKCDAVLNWWNKDKKGNFKMKSI